MTDLVLELWVSTIIEWSRFRWAMGAGRTWKPGEKLHLLFAGYNGTRNTGSDVRVEEMLRQVRLILGEENTRLSVLSQNFEASKGYFRGSTQVRLPDIFPPFLAREVPRHDGVVACEGSMFKSKFANALTTMMIGALGIAAAQNRLSVGYGAEAGSMDPLLAKMVKRYCRDAFVVTRNEESRGILSRLGVPTELGTDTAWTFTPHGPEYGKKVLSDHGWDGKRNVLVICPINPFWWPVKASLVKGILHKLTGSYRDSHYRSLYFHRAGREVDAAYERYLRGISNAVINCRRRRDVFPVLVAMERLDTRSCVRMSELLGGVPVLNSDEYDMYQLVSVLHCCQALVSSRYHAIVTSMCGLVPSAGISMDERIRNLMRERGHDELLLDVDDPDIEEKLPAVLDRLHRDKDAIQEAIGRTVAKNLKVMARMGVYFEDQVRRRYPEFPIPGGIRSWEEYLPPISASLRGLLETYS